ncbi:hypothetical protein CHS0354_004898, partial [Potamilus streckersoni]
MSGPTVTTDHARATDSNEIDLSIISSGRIGNGEPEASSEKKEKQENEVEQSSEKCLTSLVSFSIVFGIGSMFTYTVNSYLSSQITTIEKVFGLSSSKSGMLLSANDVGFLTTVLFASHFLHR